MVIKSCVFCLNKLTEVQSYNSRVSGSQRETLEKYRKNCSISLCELLSIENSHSKTFEESNYCSECHELILNIDSTIRSIKILQEQLRLSRKIIRKYIVSNYGSSGSIKTNHKSTRLKKDKKLTAQLNRIAKIIKNKPLINDNHNQDLLRSYEKTEPLAVGTLSIQGNSLNNINNTATALDLENIKIEPDFPSELISSSHNLENKTYLNHVNYDIDTPINSNDSPIRDDQKNASSPNSPPVANAQNSNISSKSSNKTEKTKNKLKKSEKSGKKRVRKRKCSEDESKFRYRCNEGNCFENSPKFISVISVRRHIESEHGGSCLETPYHCLECSLQFAKLFYLEKHKNKEHAEPIHPCNYCSRKFGTEWALKRHLNSSHASDAKYVLLPKCSICLKSFENSGDIPAHEEAHKKLLETPYPFTCLFCPLNLFTNNFDLQKHVRQEHETELFKCTHCSHVSSSKNNLKTHLQLHEGTELPHECSICNKKFRVRYQLKLHLLTHSEPTFFCDFENCASKFHKKARLNRHKYEVHKLGSKFHKCPLCPKECPTTDSLKRHITTHSDIRPFLCHICSLPLKNRSSLTKHLKTHERIKKRNRPVVFPKAKKMKNETTTTTTIDQNVGVINPINSYREREDSYNYTLFGL